MFASLRHQPRSYNPMRWTILASNNSREESLHAFKATRPALLALIGVALASSASAQSWLDQKLLAAAKKEGAPVVYGSMNEEEALPYYKIFTDATGIKVTYVRTSDTGVMGRIAVEFRAKQHVWDVVMTTPVNRL